MDEQIFNDVVVAGSGVAAEATQTEGPHSICEQGRVTQRLSVPSLTSVEQCQHVADLVLAHWMNPEVSGAEFDRALDAEIATLAA